MSNPSLVATLDKALRDEMGDDGSIHSWRCEHPDVYGPCTCVAELAEVLASALKGIC